MPTYDATDMTEFMRLVRVGNSGFRESASSLRNLLRLLRRDSQASQIAAAINAIPGTKQTRYQQALDHLKGTFPGLQGQGMFGTQIARLAETAFEDRETRVETRYLTETIEQTQSGTDYSWDVKLTFEDRATAIVVKPVIRYRAKPGDPNGHAPTQEELEAWKRQIQGAWKATFLVDDKRKDVSFDIQFVGWNAAVATGAYRINVVDISVQDAQEEILVNQGVMAVGSSLRTQNWRVKQQARELTLDGTSLGTPNMGEWGVRDMQAVVHEFGHAIGNPDEYDVTAHNINYGGHATSYNVSGFTTDSLMNDTRKAKIYKRHYAVVAKLYRDWKTAPGRVPVVSIVDPKT